MGWSEEHKGLNGDQNVLTLGTHDSSGYSEKLKYKLEPESLKQPSAINLLSSIKLLFPFNPVFPENTGLHQTHIYNINYR